MRTCPECRTTLVSVPQHKSFSTGKAVLGAVVAGPYGILAGGLGSNRAVEVCPRCTGMVDPDLMNAFLTDYARASEAALTQARAMQIAGDKANEIANQLEWEARKAHIVELTERLGAQGIRNLPKTEHELLALEALLVSEGLTGEDANAFLDRQRAARAATPIESAAGLRAKAVQDRETDRLERAARSRENVPVWAKKKKPSSIFSGVFKGLSKRDR